jgi:hypothetical protein
MDPKGGSTRWQRNPGSGSKSNIEQSHICEIKIPPVEALRANEKRQSTAKF